MADKMYCEIRVQGHLSPRWSEWFGGLGIEDRPHGEGVLVGTLPDQAALYGVLDRLRDLGIALISLRCDEVEGCGPQGARLSSSPRPGPVCGTRGD
jgi:hypothetical protein